MAAGTRDMRRGCAPGVTLQQRTGISLNRLGPGIGDDTAGIPHKISHLTGHQNQAPAWKSGQKTVPW